MTRNQFIVWLGLTLFLLVKNDAWLGLSALTFVYTLFIFLYFGYLTFKKRIKWQAYALRLLACGAIMVLPSILIGVFAVFTGSSRMSLVLWIIAVLVNILNYKYWKTDTKTS